MASHTTGANISSVNDIRFVRKHIFTGMLGHIHAFTTTTVFCKDHENYWNHTFMQASTKQKAPGRALGIRTSIKYSRTFSKNSTFPTTLIFQVRKKYICGGWVGTYSKQQ